VTPIPSFPLNGEGVWKVFMKRKTKKSLEARRRIVAYLDGLQAKVNVLRELQSASGEELSALTSSPSVASGMPSMLDRAFKGEL
jgi:hypothetical protein